MRYKINLATARAVYSPGLMHEDRCVLLEKAREIAAAAASRWRLNKAILVAYCELGVAAAKTTGKTAIFDEAMHELKVAEDRIGDRDVCRLIAGFAHRVSAMHLDSPDSSEILVEDS